MIVCPSPPPPPILLSFTSRICPFCYQWSSLSINNGTRRCFDVESTSMTSDDVDSTTQQRRVPSGYEQFTKPEEKNSSSTTPRLKTVDLCNKVSCLPVCEVTGHTTLLRRWINVNDVDSTSCAQMAVTTLWHRDDQTLEQRPAHDASWPCGHPGTRGDTGRIMSISKILYIDRNNG